MFIGLDRVMAQPDKVEIKGEHNILVEEHSKFLANVEAHTTRISFLESKHTELGFKEDTLNNDSIVCSEESFENRAVEQLKNLAEDQALMPIAPIFLPNEVDWKGKCQMTNLELWRFEDHLDPQTMV